MTGVLIVTHGRLGHALLEAASMLVSESKAVRAIDFMPGQGVEDLDASVRTAVADMLLDCSGILCLVDLPGGTPARVVGGLTMATAHVDGITGVNLPMLVEVILSREGMTLADLAVHAVHSGSDGIVNLGTLLRPAGGAQGEEASQTGE